jgi:hypothetical protein
VVRCGAGFAVGDETWFRRYPFGAIRASLRHPGRRPELLWHLPLSPPSNALASKQAGCFVGRAPSADDDDDCASAWPAPMQLRSNYRVLGLKVAL